MTRSRLLPTTNRYFSGRINSVGNAAEMDCRDIYYRLEIVAIDARDHPSVDVTHGICDFLHWCATPRHQ